MGDRALQGKVCGARKQGAHGRVSEGPWGGGKASGPSPSLASPWLFLRDETFLGPRGWLCGKSLTQAAKRELCEEQLLSGDGP